MCLGQAGGSGQPLGTRVPVHTGQRSDTKPPLLPMTASACHLCHAIQPHLINGNNFYTWVFSPPTWVSAMNYLEIYIILTVLCKRLSFLAVVWHVFNILVCSIYGFWWCFTQDNYQNPNSVWDTGGKSNEWLVCITQIYCRKWVLRILTLISTIFENSSIG